MISSHLSQGTPNHFIEDKKLSIFSVFHDSLFSYINRMALRDASTISLGYCGFKSQRKTSLKTFFQVLCKHVKYQLSLS